MTPLNGWTVLEAGEDEALQACGRTLAMLGAEVAKLEPPTGDPLRSRPPFGDTPKGPRSPGFEHLAAGKRSVVAHPSEQALGFTWAAAGPTATSLLATLGAGVVKVEHR